MKRVAILVETALASGRDILSGISQHLREQEDWTVFHPTGYLGSTDFSGLDQWEGDGIIARISSPQILDRVRAKGVPVVDVLGNLADSPFPLVKCNDKAIGQLVAEQFIAAGHRHFAYIGLGAERWSEERFQAYRESVRGRSRSLEYFRINPGEQSLGHWNRTRDMLAEWIGGLPVPVGMMIASDQLGPVVIKACQGLGRAVPEEVSLIGVDNDLPFCELCRPRLSSVEPGHDRVGYFAARFLDRLMAHQETGSLLLESPPQTLHVRGSSDATAVDDPALVRALQFIRERACQGISVDEVARASGLSRSVLQRRFRAQLGRTVGDAVTSVKLDRARDMLAHTRIPLLDVAERSGFNYQEYLNYAFKKHLGTTPAQYRAEHG